MGATNHDMTIITSRNETINYDFSRMTHIEAKAVRVCLVQSYRKMLDSDKALCHGA